ncbi:cation-dependent mannose-6-phosphate receptor-like [Diadema antillarum]|uniref:cation-dependent mannose-6-phosphate receptor-like n=1 Tax=Diadema antillarum TaxID=105358 RepID=UPI003A849B2C
MGSVHASCLWKSTAIKRWLHAVFFTLLSLVSILTVDAQVVCQKETNCRCTLSDNSGYYDLGPMVEGTAAPFFTIIPAETPTVTYMYDPCRDFSKVSPSSQCNDVAVCKESDNVYSNLGIHSTSSFIYIPDTSTPMRIVYHNGKSGNESVNTTVQLYCDDTGISQLLFRQSTKSVYLFQLRSPFACLKPVSTSKGLTPGGIICIIFVVVVFVYFVGGFIYLFFFKFESGTKTIPHYEFWSSLPGLIRDGFVYICTCICGDERRMPTTSSGPTYESI